MTVAQLLDILRITKQSLGRVLQGPDRARAMSSRRKASRTGGSGCCYLTDEGEELRLRLMRAADRAHQAGARRGRSPARHTTTAMFSYHLISPENRDGGARLDRHGEQHRQVMSDGHGQLAHILVVDDDRRIRELLQLVSGGEWLSRFGGAAPRRKRASRCAASTFDLLVLDVMMPGETGIELAAVAARRERRPCRSSCSRRWPIRPTASRG